MTQLNNILNKFEKKTNDRFDSIDDYFSKSNIETTHEEKCQCGCVSTVNIFGIFKRKLTAIKEFFDYSFEKKYIDKESELFQHLAVSNIELIYSKHDFEKYMYILKNLLTPDTVKRTFKLKYDYTTYYTLFHTIAWGAYSFSSEEIDEIFEFFDSISFDFTTTGTLYTDFLGVGISLMDKKIILKLLERGAKFTPTVFDTLNDKIYNNITPFKRDMDVIKNDDDLTKKLLHLIYYSDEIQELFKPEFLEYGYYGDSFTKNDNGYRQKDIEFKNNLIDFCEKNGVEYSSIYSGEFDTQYGRSWKIRPPNTMELYIEIIKIVKEFLTQEMKVKLMNKYMEGSRPIEKIFPLYHHQFCELFS
jgi:hypothetical protein